MRIGRLSLILAPIFLMGCSHASQASVPNNQGNAVQDSTVWQLVNLQGLSEALEKNYVRVPLGQQS